MENNKVLEKLNEMRQRFDHFYDKFDKACADGTHSALVKKLKPSGKKNKLHSESLKHIKRINRKVDKLKILLKSAYSTGEHINGLEPPMNIDWKKNGKKTDN